MSVAGQSLAVTRRPRTGRVGTALDEIRRVPQARWGLIFVAPAMILFAVFALIPVFWAVQMSFTSYTVADPGDWVGADNYARMLRDPVFWKALTNTAIYVGTTVPAHIALAMGLALLLNSKLRGMVVFRSIYYLPAVTSSVAIAMMWLYLLNPQYGVINLTLEKFGLPPKDWWQDPTLALGAIIVMSIWRGIGTGMLIFLAGLQSIPLMFYEAASIDGASPWQRFWHITFPLLRPTTLFVLVTSSIGAFQVFEQPYVMTQGGPLYGTTTLVMWIFFNGFQYWKMGYASAMAVILFILIMILSLVNLRFFSSEVEY